MPGEFDMDAAVVDISASLGFSTEGDDHGSNDDVVIEVDAPAGGDSAAVVDDGTPAGSVGRTTADGKPGGDGNADNPDGTPGDPAATPADPAAEPPKTWRKEAADLWATLPVAARQEILKREEDIFKGIESYKSEAAFGKSFREVLSPFMPTLQQYNIDPAAQVAELMQAHHTLALGSPQEKAALLTKIAADYRIPLGQPAALEDLPYVDPAVKDLQTQMQAIHSKLSEADRGRQSQALAERRKEVDTFASDPKNTHFESVASDMFTLIQGGVCKNLQEAYDKAVWANPVTRDLEIKRLQAAELEKTRTTAAAKVEAARKATSANVRTSAKSGGATASLGSIDDTLKETLAKLRPGT